MGIKLWLDDIRDPMKHGYFDFYWVKNYQDAIDLLSTGKVAYASLDHDIGACKSCVDSLMHIGDMKTTETTFFNRCPHEKSGYDVICWMKLNNVWPVDGVRVHSMNPVGKYRMDSVVRGQYGRIFQ